jgi:hypothetical protein
LVAHFPDFLWSLLAFDELYAAFLNESRTRGRCLGRVQEIRVKPFFGLSGELVFEDRQFQGRAFVPESVRID